MLLIWFLDFWSTDYQHVHKAATHDRFTGCDSRCPYGGRRTSMCFVLIYFFKHKETCYGAEYFAYLVNFYRVLSERCTEVKQRPIFAQ